VANVLYLVHRLPYPPNKGDKVRSYHLLKHLAKQHRVFLGTFVDDPEDLIHLPLVRELCAEMLAVNLNPLRAKVLSLAALLTGDALTQRYYASKTLHTWVRQVTAQNKIDSLVVFSSAMGQYALNVGAATLLVDFVDVDSAKWAEYGENHHWPLSWLYRREARELLRYERNLAKRAQKSFFVTEKESEMFRVLAPESADLVETVGNGVDSDFFSPLKSRHSPFLLTTEQSPSYAIVFTGAMDYWPNIDAVIWFASDILPSLRAKWPHVCFYIVGRNPPSTVLALASDNIVITGTVPDVRPYLQFADVVVAPLRVARGIQNKILEAMAMARPVVASESCARVMDITLGEEMLCANSPDEFVRHIDGLLSQPKEAEAMGQAGRQRVVNSYSWSAHLALFDHHLQPRLLPEVRA
jgi:polysaccharide biosynthesis protein PslH